MDVSIFAAFVAGLVSFLSPCVLPLVPGYISMLSGIGVEQLKEGRTPRGGLLSSALAFVIGFSIVFITFGASASAVGSFLVRNRSLLAPIAGALILLFGLHLVGWLVKISVRAGLAIGAVNIPLHRLSLPDGLGPRIGLPVGAVNDGSGAALAELRLGAGRGASNLVTTWSRRGCTPTVGTPAACSRRSSSCSTEAPRPPAP